MLRNHWVPLPQVRDLEELNAYLEQCCRQDQQRILEGRSETVGTAMLREQPHLLPLAGEPFELTESSFPTVDGLRCVRVRTNRYSTPLPPGTRVEARVHADYVEVWHEGGNDRNIDDDVSDPIMALPLGFGSLMHAE